MTGNAREIAAADAASLALLAGQEPFNVHYRFAIILLATPTSRVPCAKQIPHADRL